MAESTLARWLQRLLTVAAMFGLVYLFLVMIQPYRFSMVLAEKHGRVVDAQTGKGLANVAVIVEYEMRSTTPMQAGYGCTHQKIVWTDTNGNYVIPNASEDIDVAEDMLWRMVPGFSRNYGWLLEYYKEGYVVKEDLERWVDMIEGRPVSSYGRATPYTKNGPVYIVPSVSMQRVDMASSPVMADAYIASVRSLAVGLICFLDDERNSAVSLILRSEMKASVRKLICELPPDKVLVELALRFSFNDCAASLGMKKILEKRGEGAVLTTGVMCESYNYVPGEYECQSLENRKIPPLQLVPDPRLKSAQPSD